MQIELQDVNTRGLYQRSLLPAAAGLEMPLEPPRRGGVDFILDLDDIPGKILALA
ncbi:MAG: hypothetical protein V1794_14600 [Candidatus Glassbacteria bacterium]